mgnify:CR=1 FL=1
MREPSQNGAPLLFRTGTSGRGVAGLAQGGEDLERVGRAVDDGHVRAHADRDRGRVGAGHAAAEHDDVEILYPVHLNPNVRQPVKDILANNLQYAILHRDIVARFGRFPHRNAVLGRESTPEEIEFLKDGPRFGQ